MSSKRLDFLWAQNFLVSSFTCSRPPFWPQWYLILSCPWIHWGLKISCGLYIVLFPVLGPEFQTRIRQNEQNNPKFNFLNTGDPYHAYYQHKVKEFKENDGKSK